MQSLPSEIRFAILTVVFMTVILIVFLIIIVILYNRKQVVLQQQQKIRETEYHNQLLKKEVEYRKDVQKELLRISQDMHDDLGAGISAMKLQSEFLKKHIKDENVGENVDGLLKLCGSLNASMRELLWSLNSENDSLSNLVEYVIQYAFGFFQNTGIKVEIEKNHIPNDMLQPKIRRHIFLCIKESLNNVYKHSEAENVLLKFSHKDGTFSIDIVDDGIGLKTDTKEGNGLQNMKCRMSSINGSFNIIPENRGLHIQLLINI